nr:MAG TPA: Baseplate wedge protein [Caudoviricetes sp.]
MSSKSTAIKDVILISSKNERIPLSSMYSEINLFEDIYSNFVSGNISVVDTLGILPKFGVIGYETLTFVFDINNKTVEKDFFVYSISNRESLNESSNFFILNFISYEGIIDSRITVSQKFTGSYSDMASEIFKKYKSQKSFYTTEEKSNTQFVSPLWNPSKILNSLSQRAISNNDDRDFFFFETILNGFKFASLNGIRKAQNENYKKYNYTIMNTNITDATDNSDTGNIREYKIIKSFDSLENTIAGGVASRALYIDLNTKQIISQDFSQNEYKKDITYIPNTDLTNKSPSKIYDCYNIVGYECAGLYDGKLSNKTQYPENWQQHRITELSNFQNVKLQLTVFGDMYLSAGDTIEVYIPKGALPSQNNNPIDDVISGLFYITSLRQFINKNIHYTSIEICKSVPDKKLNNIG